jgi:SAM-dependent methyltransferase
MGPGAIASVTTDFRSIDFDRLWVGRDNTTFVERAMLARLLSEADTRRTLEIGTGAGRLTPELRRRAEEYVGLDLHPEFLSRVPTGPGPSRSMRVVGDAHHAPFVDHAFTAIVLVRVYNFLPDPGVFLQEMKRLLVPGGHLIIGYQPRPSMATLVDDIRMFLRNDRAEGSRTLTFARAPLIRSGPGPFPSWVPTRRHLRATLESSGFAVRRTLSTGLEDYVVGRRLPPSIFVRVAESLDHAGWLPTQFVDAQSVSDLAPGPLPDWSTLLACPECGATLASSASGTRAATRCGACRHEVQVLEDDPPVSSKGPAKA